MKNLGFLDKILLVVNSLLAFALLLSYLLPYAPPLVFPFLSVLSLGVPVLIMGNFIFLVYWALRLKRQILLPLIVLLLGYNYIFSLFQVPGTSDNAPSGGLTIMSYNVRMFNAFNWVKDKHIPEKISRFVAEQDPDVLVTQEHYVGVTDIVNNYPYSYIKLKEKGSEFGSAIFSKYLIINKQSLDFSEQGNNNAIYVDIVKNQDTLRVFNVHLQSLNIKPEINDLQKEDSKKLIGRIGNGFKLQQKQAEHLMEEVDNSPYKTVITGDFNNTAFSYVYKLIRKDRFKDAFLEAGKGFGKTFDLSYFPLRIDFFLIDKVLNVETFEVFGDVDYSDHFPLMVRIGW